jgi:ferredoxin
MKAKVDADKCIGCGLCEATCPEVFRLNNDVSQVIVDTVPPEAQENCRQAADNCPVQAISLDE